MRILFVEDTPPDMVLILRALKKDGISPVSRRVASVADLRRALEDRWDVILSDYNLPGFTAVDVLRVIRAARVETPVIVISSAVTDEAAAELMRNGAADFVRKENTARLCPAIRREVQAAADRSRHEDRLRRSELHFRTLADSIPQLAWMTDGEGRVYWHNANWAAYTGVSIEEIRAKGWGIVHHPEHAARVNEKWMRHVASGEPYEDTFLLRGRNGEWRWFLSRASAARDAHGRVINWCGTNTDVTELQELRRTENEAKQEAINANNLKSAFLANMSHEIRTPLAAILGFADILRGPELSSSERGRYLDIISRNGHALTKIIDDILDLSKIEAGKLEIERAPVRLRTLVADVIAMFRDRAEAKGVELDVDVNRLPAAAVSSDGVRIRQVLVNLIGNAIKFTSSGRIEVRGDHETRPDGAVAVRLRIIDTGIGLSRENAEAIFKPFVQGDNKNSRKYGGTGLGLALSKRLGQALGGDVTLEAYQLGRGCTFCFDFVAADATLLGPRPGPRPAPAREERSGRLHGVRVLVVDDAPDNRALMQIYLAREGAQVETCGDGESACAAALNGSFDVVLMDIQMPGLEGFEALARLRARRYRGPILALTAHAMKEDRRRALDAGFEAHLTKPVDREELVAVIQRFVPSVRSLRPPAGEQSV